MDGRRIPRVVAATDLPGFGRVALSAMAPVLAAMGVQTCPLPTAVLSTHGAYPEPSCHDMTSAMRDMVAHWRRLGLGFDAVYSGFLAGEGQFELVGELCDGIRAGGGLALVDPVLGDHGRLYGLFGPDHVGLMRGLCARASLATPNLTEAALLLGLPPDAQPRGDAELKDWLRGLAALGPATVVVTSCPAPGRPDRGGAAAFGGGRFWRVAHELRPVNYPGTGDVFAAVLLGALLGGAELPAALAQAAGFAAAAVAESHAGGGDPREGLLLERLLDRAGLTGGLRAEEI